MSIARGSGGAFRVAIAGASAGGYESVDPNSFGTTLPAVPSELSGMPTDSVPADEFPIERWLDALGAPSGNGVEFVDARELPPPKPLSTTLERLPELDDDATLLQLNDRAPQFLYPKLDDRGYAYETIEVDEGVATAIWR